MEIKKQNKFVTFFKRFGVYVIAGVTLVVIVVAATLIGVLTKKKPSQDVPVDTQPLVFVSPVSNASVIKDFNDTKLQYNETLNKWEAHFSVDLASEDLAVMAVLDGTVSDVYYKYMTGYVVTIKHDDGFTSVYSSLDKDVDVQKGDQVKKGQKIGNMSTSGAGEASYGAHLDFSLYQDGENVDPNNYISLQNK